MNKEDVVHIYTTEYYSTIKMKRMRPFEGTWMELEMIILHEVSQTEKDKYDITYMWNLKNNTNESIQKIQTDLQLQKTNMGNRL